MSRQTALTRQDLSRMYLAHHELESKFNITIIVTNTIVFIVIVMAAVLQCKPSVAASTVVWGGM